VFIEIIIGRGRYPDSKVSSNELVYISQPFQRIFCFPSPHSHVTSPSIDGFSMDHFCLDMNRKDTDSADFTQAARCTPELLGQTFSTGPCWTYLDLLAINRLALTSLDQGMDLSRKDLCFCLDLCHKQRNCFGHFALDNSPQPRFCSCSSLTTIALMHPHLSYFGETKQI
jgi:hypothetical protein